MSRRERGDRHEPNTQEPNTREPHTSRPSRRGGAEPPGVRGTARLAPSPPGTARLAPAPPASASPAPARRETRGDIEGLRAVAVLAVLAYHAGVPFLPGGFVGVDVFFVISGFLITGLVTDELTRTGRLSFPRFYARRIRRLLPAAALVLVATAVASWALLSPVRRQGVGFDIASAAGYVSNWRFAAQATDYLAEDLAPSPVLHYWSLSVEEQYYLAWPFLLVAVTAVARRRGRDLTWSLAVTVATVGATSFGFALFMTSASPSLAFFATPTRAWELALGAALAIGAGRLAAQPAALRLGLGWAGLTAIVGSLVLLNRQTPFPGLAALVPTLGAAAVLAAGTGQAHHVARGGVALSIGGGLRLLDTAPMRTIGRLSYSLYLWHWPALVFATAMLDRPLTVPEGVAITCLAAVPAAASYRWVEEPLRHSRPLVAFPRRAAVLAVATTVAAGVAGLAVARTASVTVQVPVAAENAPSTGRGPTIGGSGAPGEIPDPRRTVTVDPVAAVADLPSAYRDDCYRGYAEHDLRSCRYGQRSAARHMVIFGDSHAIQWLPALAAIGREHGWAVELQAKVSCPPASIDVWDTRRDMAYLGCTAWRERVLKRLTESSRPELVLVSGRATHRGLTTDGRRADFATSQAQLADGLAETLRRLRAAGLPVVVITDSPFPGLDVPACMSEHGSDLEACSFPRSDGVRAHPPEVQAAAAVPGVDVVDLNDHICPGPVCRPVVEGRIAYRDSHHLTASFAESLAPLLADALERAGIRLG